MMTVMRLALFLPLLLGCLKPEIQRFEQLQATPTPAVVRAVLFYSPNCGHCHYVIEEVLPLLLSHYGDRLQIIGVDVSTSEGFRLFEAAWGFYNAKGSGVPFLAVGDQYLVGSADIPQKFPELIESHLAQGGLDWPAIPELAELVQSAQTQATATPPPTLAAPASVTPQVGSGILQLNQPPAGLSEKFLRDPLGNGLAVFILVGMVVSLGAGMRGFRKHVSEAPAGSPRLAVAVLCVIGVGVAGYLAYVETTQSLAMCGPVGDCNTVQQSEYARLFGILPIGVLGILGYLGVLAAWLVSRYSPDRLALLAALAMFAMSLLGVLFSIYLTFLEPFVIGATCAWCLTSAVIMTALFWLSLTPARAALQALQRDPDPPVLSTR